jgi:hypothetical protein
MRVQCATCINVHILVDEIYKKTKCKEDDWKTIANKIVQDNARKYGCTDYFPDHDYL